MSGFANQIIGGLSKLIRPAIQSPNYKPSTSGWTVNADGSAEFNDATFRGTVVINSGGTALLVYDGAPAAGNLILSISAFAGNDAFGNNYPGGICVTNANGTAGNAGYTARWNPTDPLAGVQPLSLGFLNNLQTGLVSQLEMFLQTNNQDLLLTSGIANQVRIFSSDFSLGAGPRGKYYSEEVNLHGGQALPNNTQTQLTNFSPVQLNSDYGSAFDLAAGMWTCPVSSDYDVTLECFLGSVASGRVSANIYPILDNDQTLQGGESVLASGTRYIKAGTVVTFYVYQATGAANTVSLSNDLSFIKICRRL